MNVFFGFGCNICYKTDDGSLKDISEENMQHLKDILITFVGHADINYNEIYLCQWCCEELKRFDKFRELCYSHLIQLRKLDLEGNWATFVHEVLRRNSLETNNCPISITTEYNEVKSFQDLNESDLDFNGQVINLQSQRNKCEFVGDCSNGSVINSVIKCDESLVTFTNEEDIKNVIIKRSEHTKLETFDVSNVSDTSQIRYMKEEIDLNDEVESNDTEIFSRTRFENKSGEQGNLDVKEPAVNDSSDSMKQELHVKQENSHSEGVILERIADEFGDGVHVAFEIGNACTFVNEVNDENEDIRNQEGKIGRILRSSKRNSTLTAAIDAQSNRLHVRGDHNRRSSNTLQSGARNRVHPDVETHTCTVCNKSFRTRRFLTGHARTHNDGRPHKCTVCNKTFTQSGSLTSHERIHSGARPYQCTVCIKTFARLDYLTAHERIHSGARPHKCTVCNKTFTDASNLTKHERIHSGAKPYKCTVCNKTFTQSGNLTKHERIHSGVRPYKCTVCIKTFARLDYLTAHERIHSGARPHKCTVCNKTFTVSSNLTTHERIHSGVRPYKCTVCIKTFARLDYLTAHERIHSGARPHKCTVCNKTFTDASKLTRHERIHSGAKPYKCTVCNKTFTQSGDLTKHERIHSGVRPYKCTVCNKTFTVSSNLTTHERIHSGVRSYKCTVCNKMFTRVDNLTKHGRIHSGARTYKCTVCNKTFKHAHHLVEHKRTHRDGRP